MKIFIAFAITCVALASAQFDFKNHKKHKGHNFVLDYVHNYKFVEHHKKNHTLLIAISDVRKERQCHVIEIDAHLTKELKHYDVMQNVTEEIFNLIKDGGAVETKLNHSQIFKEYHDRPLVKACRHHKTFAMEYTPGFEISHHTHNHTHHHHTHRPHHHTTHRPHHHGHHGHHSTHRPHHHTTHRPHHHGHHGHHGHHSTHRPHHHSTHRHGHHRNTTPTMMA